MAEITEDQAPRKARDLFEKGYAAMERGNIDYAIDMLTASLEIEPRFLRARKFLRVAEMKKFKEGKASAVTRFLTIALSLPQILAVTGAVKKKPEQALRMAEQLLRKDPMNLVFVNLLGRAAIAADMPEVAVQTLEVAKDYYSKNADVLEWLGKLYLQTNQAHKARECFETIVALRPNDPTALKALKDATALDTLQKGKWDTAESYRDVMKDEQEAVLIEQEGKSVKSEKDLESLIQETRRKIQTEPTNINYRRMLGDLLARIGRHDEALAALAEAQKASGNADPQIDLQMSAVRVKQFDGEIARLRAAGNESAAQMKEKQKELFLLEDARERVKRYPNDLQFRFELGVILYQRSVLNEAIQQFQLSQRNPHRRIRSLYYLALCFKQKQQYDIAMEQLQKAAAEIYLMDDTKKDITYEMGSISEAMGQLDKAAAYYKEIYAVDIGYKDVAEKIDRLYKK